MSTDLTIIVPSKDRNEILSITINRLLSAIRNLNIEVIVINDSKTKQITVEPNWINKVLIFDNPKSGVASARNLGANKASSEVIVFMDDDMWVSEDNVLSIINLHKKYQVGCCFNLNWVYPPELIKQIKSKQFGRYLNYFGFDSLKGWCRDLFWDDNSLFPINHITSQFLSFRKSEFCDLGGYNESFPHAGFEDYDLSKRLHKAGIQPYVNPLSMLYHNEADRMNVKSWLARKRRGGETRKVAVQMGYNELAIQNGWFKSLLYNILVYLQPALLAVLWAIPNFKIFDSIYFKVLNISLGTAFYDGYNRS